MSDEATDTPGASEGGGVATAPAVPEEAQLAPLEESPEDVARRAQAEHHERVRSRFWLPLLVPVGAVVAVGFVVVNLSRLFLATNRTGGVISGTIITILILAGAAAVSAMPRARTPNLVLTMCGIMVLVLLVGTVMFPASQEKKKEASGYVAPTGPAVYTLSVDALASLSFQAKTFYVPAGIVDVKYVDVSGSTHTLVFSAPKLAGFELQVPAGPKEGKVDLTPGKYEIYCTIPGHRAAGMDATVIVGPGGSTTTGAGGAGASSPSAPAGSSSSAPGASTSSTPGG